MLRSTIICAATLLALVAVACTNKSPPAPVTLGYRTVVEAHDIDGRLVGAAPDKRATIVVFFATWCGPCRHELQILDELHAARPNVRIIGVNAYEEWRNMSDQAKLRNFLKHNAQWLQVVRADKAIFEAFGGVPKIPSLFVFDRNGRIIKEYRGARRAPPTRGELDRLLGEIGPTA